MHDIKYIRDNPQDFDAAMARRSLPAQSQALLNLDEERRRLQTQIQEYQSKRNDLSRKIGELKRKGEDVSALMAQANKDLSAFEEFQEREKTLGESLNHHLSSLPNILMPDVPEGRDETANKEIYKWGEIKSLKGPDHADIGEALGMMDFEAAAKMSGSRFTLLSDGLARLERALGAFFLDVHTREHGYTEVSPPLLVRDNAAFGTNQLPKFAEDLFRTTTGHWLIPTSEVSLTNIVAEMILEEQDLPRRFTALTPCFRSEAGSAGKDTRGMLRQHQFYKVELVSISTPEKSAAEHERMLECAQAILKKLELPFRTVLLCSGDTGFGAQKTYDIEVWLPGQEAYREISSCSSFGDFQARRMNARYRPTGDKKARFVNTLNGSGVAVGRALIAIMENYYDPADGGIWVPNALKPYMAGVDKIVKR